MNKQHYRRTDGVDGAPLRAIGHPVRRALAESGTRPDSAPPHRIAMRRADHPWSATETFE